MGGAAMLPIATERLILRNYRRTDWRALQAMVSLPEVRRFEPHWDPSDAACQASVAAFSEADTFIVAEDQASARLLGHVYFSQTKPEKFRTWELGYIFHPDHHRRGYATEACRAVLEHAFQRLGAHRVIAGCCPQNLASWRLMERLGMRREAFSPKAVTLTAAADGTPIWWDQYLYAVLAEEWPERSALFARG
jgi:[ribosomal protein S5]-alanine N-acetyltransferase